MKHIIVTGASGFIGKHTVPLLRAEGFTVTEFGRSSSLSLLKRMPQGSIFLALAGRMPKGETGADELRKQVNANSLHAVTVLDVLKGKVSRVVYVSSIDVYGPLQGKRYDETHPASPSTVYGIAKLCGELLVSQYCRENALPLMIIRPSQVYGPGDTSGKVISRFIEGIREGKPISLFGHGEDERTYLYAGDLARALTLAVGSSATGTFNVAGDEHISIAKLVLLIEKVCGVRARVEKKPRKEAASKQRVCTKKIQEVLGWHPEITLTQGLALCL